MLRDETPFNVVESAIEPLFKGYDGWMSFTSLLHNLKEFNTLSKRQKIQTILFNISSSDPGKCWNQTHDPAIALWHNKWGLLSYPRQNIDMN